MGVRTQPSSPARGGGGVASGGAHRELLVDGVLLEVGEELGEGDEAVVVAAPVHRLEQPLELHLRHHHAEQVQREAQVVVAQRAATAPVDVAEDLAQVVAALADAVAQQHLGVPRHVLPLGPLRCRRVLPPIRRIPEHQRAELRVRNPLAPVRKPGDNLRHGLAVEVQVQPAAQECVQIRRPDPAGLQRVCDAAPPV